MVYKFFEKKAVSSGGIKNENISNQPPLGVARLAKVSDRKVPYARIN